MTKAFMAKVEQAANAAGWMSRFPFENQGDYIWWVFGEGALVAKTEEKIYLLAARLLGLNVKGNSK